MWVGGKGDVTSATPVETLEWENLMLESKITTKNNKNKSNTMISRLACAMKRI